MTSAEPTTPAEKTSGPLDVAAGFSSEILDRAEAIEDACRMPADLAARMAAAGLFRLLVPSCYGGLQAHPQVFFDTLARVAQADGAVGWVLMIGATTGVMAASLPEPWAQRVYGDNPDAITCGVTAPIGRATATATGLTVTGRWPFGSASQVADWICGGCRIVDNNGQQPNQSGAPQVALVFFPADQVTVHTDTWRTSGLRGTGSHDIEVVNTAVPEGCWAQLGQRPLVTAPLYRFPTLGLLALGVSAVALGIARHAIDEFVALATNKVPTGSGRTLAQRGGVQKDLARAEALVQSATALTADAIGSAWMMANQSGKLSTDCKARLRLAATNNAWSAAQAVDLLYHCAGGSAIYSSNPLQRCFRDVHVATQHIMVAQPTYEVVGKVQLGIDPKTML